MQYKIETPPPAFGNYSNITDDSYGGMVLASQRTVAVIPSTKHSSFGQNFIANVNNVSEISFSSFKPLLTLANTPIDVPHGYQAVTSIIDMNTIGDIAYELMFVPTDTKHGAPIEGKRGGSFVYSSREQKSIPIDPMYQLIKLTDGGEVILEKYSDHTLHSLLFHNQRWETMEYSVQGTPARMMFGSFDDWHLVIEESGITDEFGDLFLRHGTKNPIRLDEALVTQDMHQGLVVGIAAPGGDTNKGIGAYWFQNARSTPLFYSELNLSYEATMALPYDVSCSSNFGVELLQENYLVVGGVTKRTNGHLFEDHLQPDSIPMLWSATTDALLNQKPIEGRSLKDVIPGDTVTEAKGVTSGGTILAKTAKYPNGALLVPA
jgi:hypothetical protein